MENFRIITEIENDLVYVLAKQKIAIEFVKQLKAKIDIYKVTLSKYKPVFEYNNIFFSNIFDKKIENLSGRAVIKITFDQKYSPLKMTNIMKQINILDFHMNDSNWDFDKKKYTLPSDNVVFDLNFKQ